MIHRKVKKLILWSLTNEMQAKILSLLLNTTTSKTQQSYDCWFCLFFQYVTESLKKKKKNLSRCKEAILLHVTLSLLRSHMWDLYVATSYENPRVKYLLHSISVPREQLSFNGQNTSLVGMIDLRLFSCMNLTCVAGLWYPLFWYTECFPMDARLTRVDHPQKESEVFIIHREIMKHPLTAVICGFHLPWTPTVWSEVVYFIFKQQIGT